MKLGLGAYVVIAVVVIAIIAYLLLSSGPATVSTTQSITLGRNGTYIFYLSGDPNVSSLEVISSSYSNATVYVGKMPLLLGTIQVLRLVPGQSDNLSIEGSQTADLNILLASSAPTATKLTLTYIPAGFGVHDSSGIGTVSLTGGSTLPASTTTVSATTTAGSGSSSSTTAASTASTTTVATVSLTEQAILGAYTLTSGIAISGLSAALAEQTSGCTQSIYDQKYSTTYVGTPSGPLTYQNISADAPHNISAAAVRVSGGIYNITYTESIPAGDRPFGKIEYNLTGNYLVSQSYNGDFGGTYTAIYDNYTTFSKTSDICLVYGV